MEKPIELAVYEFNESLVNLINNSGLPAFIVVQSLQAVLAEVAKIAEQNLQTARKTYEEGDKQDG